MKEARGQRCDRSALGHPHLGPAIHESPERTVGFAQIDIFAAGFRQRRRQFGIAERAEQRQQSAEHPDREHHPGRADVLDHGLRHQENPAADHGARPRWRRRSRCRGRVSGCSELRIRFFHHFPAVSSTPAKRAQPTANVTAVPIRTYQVNAIVVNSLHADHRHQSGHHASHGRVLPDAIASADPAETPQQRSVQNGCDGQARLEHRCPSGARPGRPETG